MPVTRVGLVTALAGGLALSAGVPEIAHAQSWPSWANDAFDMSSGRSRRVTRPPAQEPAWPGNPASRYGRYDGYGSYQAPLPPLQPPFQPRAEYGAEELDGGPRPEIAPIAPPLVAFYAPYEAGSIVIDTRTKKLYAVQVGGRAYAYDISVGREGFSWTGTEKVSRKQEWPDWHPPAEMRERDPKLPIKMLGGIRNPLGAMALYLGTTLYRIHGTNDEKSIGRAESSGCFRMMNASVLHLASITPVGTTVTVVDGLPGQAETAAAPAPAPAPRQTARARADERWREDDERRYIERRRAEERPWRPAPSWNSPPPWGWGGYGYSHR